MNENFKLWTDGRRGCVACVTVTVYQDSIVATADPEKITEKMMRWALRKEFPRHTFYLERDGGDCIRLQADRWNGDELT